jgi:hypothetical protein
VGEAISQRIIKALLRNFMILYRIGSYPNM